MNGNKTTLALWITNALIPAIAWLVGGFDALFWAFVILISLDWLSGILEAAYKRERFSWQKANQGLIRILLYFCLLMAVTRIQHDIGIPLDPNAKFTLRNGLLIYLCTVNFASVIDHAGGCGIPIPDIIHTAVKALYRYIGARSEIEKKPK